MADTSIVKPSLQGYPTPQPDLASPLILKYAVLAPIWENPTLAKQLLYMTMNSGLPGITPH